MRQFLRIWAACAALTLALVQPAYAQDVSADFTVATSYFDLNTFNARNSAPSDGPVVKIDVSIEPGNGVYIEPYVYSDLGHPFNGPGSEYGVMVGRKSHLTDQVTLDIGVGRFANYGGGGFNAGDWVVRAGLEIGNLTVSGSALIGDTNTVIARIDYELQPTSRITVRPSVAFYTRDHRINPGLEVEYAISEHVAARLVCVAPESEDRHGRRGFYLGGELTLSL
jgi:hypothetical protein